MEADMEKKAQEPTAKNGRRTPTMKRYHEQKKIHG